MQTSLNNGMCRCCASEGTFKNFTNTYHWMGEEEVYADMLKECFDISLTTSDPGEEGGICEVCITQLRNAANFKKQVLNTEQQFQRRLQDKLFKTELVKVEETCLDEAADDNSDNDNNISEDFSGPEYDLQIKAESPEEAKPKKRTAKATTSRAKKTKIDDGEPSTKRARKPKKTIIVLGKKPPRLLKKNIIEIKPQPKTKIIIKKLNEAHKHQENMKQILLCSNATPIRCRRGIGYTCCFCNDQYPEAADLKKHTIDKHDKETFSTFKKNQSLLTYIVKLDITHLCCNICDDPFDNLDKLMDHLTSKHDKFFHRDLKDHIVPFKFERDGLYCVICNNEYNNFKVLLEHMNVHYGNFVCEVCGAGFVNRKMLQTHGYRHRTGEFICTYCSKIFDTRVKQRDHERAVHVCLNKRSKCGYCGEKFSDYAKKKDHEVKVHGARPVILKCNGCNKTFANQRSLTIHTKASHLMKRRETK